MLNKNEAVIAPEDGLAAQSAPQCGSRVPIRCWQLNYLDCCKFATVQVALCSRSCKLLRCWAGAQAKDYPQGSKLIGSDLDAEMAGEVMR